MIGSLDRRTRWFLVAGMVVALVLAFFISPLASSSPDGLERVAIDNGLDTEVQDHTFADGPLADYSVAGVDDEALGTGLSGVIGVVATFALGSVVLLVVRRRTPSTPAGTPVAETVA